MVLILFVQVLKKVLKSLKFELKNPAETLCVQKCKQVCVSKLLSVKKEK